MSLVQEWKKLIADEEEKLEKINRQIIVNNEEKEKQIKLIQSIRNTFNRFYFFLFSFIKEKKPKRSERAPCGRVARPEGPLRATPQGQRACEACDAKNNLI